MNLQEFARNLQNEELYFLEEVFPSLLSTWLFDHTKLLKQGSDKPKLIANRYKPVDALAVGLLHLRDLYKVRPPSVLYRVVEEDPPAGKKYTITPNKVVGPLLSFSESDDPFSNVEEYYDDGSWLLLSWQTIPKLVLATPDSLSQLVKDGKRLFNNANWNKAGENLRKNQGEEECIVYVGQPLVCSWEILETDNDW